MRTGSLTLLTAACAIATGCGGGSGDDVPTNGVAKVGDAVITKAAFQDRLEVALKGQAGPDGKPVELEPPEYKACIAAKRQGAQAPEGGDPVSEADLKEACAADYTKARVDVMEFLVQSTWVDEEADARKVEVTEKDVRKAFEKAKKDSFPNEAAYQKFLRVQGQTEKDVLESVRAQLLQQSLNEKVVEGKLKVTDAEARTYYEAHKKELGKPERRRMRFLLATSEAKATEAKQELDDGGSWETVAKKYSQDKTTAAKGGLLPEVTETGDKALDKAMKDAETNAVTGPVKSQFGWVVLEIEKVMPASVPTFEDAKKRVMDAAKEEKRQKALDDFAREFREKYRGQTVCADEFKVASCGNGPLTNPTATTPSMQPKPNPEQNR